MSWHDKIIWTEGMFLRPQHFQQQDRYVQQLIETRCASLRPYGWGFAELELDDSLLLQGRLALASCRGVLPDGTPFACSTAEELPAPLEVAQGVGDTCAYLVLPLRRPGVLEIQQAGASNGIERYQSQEYDVRDSSTGDSDGTANIQVGSLNLRLILAGDELHEYSSLGVARIIERRADNSVILDENFIPPCLDCRAAPRLAAFINEIVGLLNYRGEALAGRVTEAGRGGVAEFADFLLLMLVNRMELLFQHLAKMNTLHPELFYETCLQLAGELATFTAKNRRPAELPPYHHDALAESFMPLMEEVRRSLRMVIEQNAIAIPLEKKKKFNMYVAAVPDRSLFKNAVFVLAVNANISGDRLRRHFPSQTKIGPVEKISELVNLQLPGIGLSALPVAPRQIPYHAGSTYFEFDRSSDFWRDLQKSGGFAMHVAGEFPGLEMACWAIRG